MSTIYKNRAFLACKSCSVLSRASREAGSGIMFCSLASQCRTPWKQNSQEALVPWRQLWSSASLPLPRASPPLMGLSHVVLLTDILWRVTVWSVQPSIILWTPFRRAIPKLPLSTRVFMRLFLTLSFHHLCVHDLSQYSVLCCCFFPSVAPKIYGSTKEWIKVWFRHILHTAWVVCALQIFLNTGMKSFRY